MVENIVYFLGAGFSRPLGLPIMSDFLEKSKDMYFENPTKYLHFEKVIETIKEMSVIKSYYSADLFNIEEILSILEMKDFISERKNSHLFKDYIKSVIEHFTPNFEKMFSTHRNSLYNSLFSGIEIFNHYGYFVGNLINLVLGENKSENIIFCPPKKPVKINYSVISLNYDMIIENYLDLIGNNFANDFSKGKVVYYGNKNDKINDDYFLSIVKLHGSAHDNSIVPPTWNKGNNRKVIQSSWRTAEELLKNANQIRIIGYSLPISDSYVKYLLKSAIIDSPHLKKIDVLCYDPFGDVTERYNEFIRYNKYRFKNADIIKYLENNYELGRRGFRKTNDTNIIELMFNSLEKAHEDFMSR